MILEDFFSGGGRGEGDGIKCGFDVSLGFHVRNRVGEGVIKSEFLE